MSLFSSNDEHFCTPFALHNKTNTRPSQIEKNRLEPESEYGNVEYKLRLTDPSPDRIERLVTQLKWRIREGQGEAILFLGVKDDGLFVGLTPEEIRLSIQTLERMSAKLGAKMTIVNERIVENDASLDELQEPVACTSKTAATKSKTIRNKAAYEKHSQKILTYEPSASSDSENTIVVNVGKKSSNSGSGSSLDKTSSYNKKVHQPTRKVLQVLVKRKTHDISDELRVAVLGPTESGKSSLLGVLSHGEYDNGRGSARLNLFRHRHEIRSGHTSSISQEIFGFTTHGQPLTYSTCLTTEEIIESSSRIVTLIDLAGHQRYLGTTLFGLGSHSPDLVLLVVSAISTLTSVTTDHISLALGMEKSMAIVINKTDLATKEDQESCYEEIVRALRLLHPEINPFKVAGLDDAISIGSRFRDSKCLPIFFASCVTGSGLSSLYGFFNGVTSKLELGDLNEAVSQSSELQVDETFEVPGIGTVVSGLMIEGIIREGDEMLLGPDDKGNFSNVSIVSLQRHKIPCNFARAGQKCTMAIATDDVRVRKGMVMKEMDTDWKQHFSVCHVFEAIIRFISHDQHKLSTGNQVSVFVGNVKQTCNIESVHEGPDNSLLVKLKLTKRPEYIREGSRIIIRHALTKGVGLVTRVVPIIWKDS